MTNLRRCAKLTIDRRTGLKDDKDLRSEVEGEQTNEQFDSEVRATPASLGKCVTKGLEARRL